ncbi:MAG TPA: hypothetical protein VL475_08495, partial [Planctomycetaceae bacterium]|nr:hypothetical protein [Planctomycetaceae bacterium]
VISGAGIEYREVGQQFFRAYYVVLAIAIYVVVPFGAFRSMLGERDLHTWEVLSITTLKPRQIVWGKLTSAVVQLFIYYSAITPFIAFANLLKGIDVPTIAFVLVASMFWSLALSMLALALSTFGSQRYWQVFLTLGVLGGLLMGMFTSISIVFWGIEAGFPFDEPGFWWVVALIASFVVVYCLLALQIAVSQLTFDADNRSSGIRIAAAGIFWLGLAWFGTSMLLQGVWGLPSFPVSDLDEVVMTFTSLAGLHWFVVGLFAATESDVLSRRVRRDIQRLGAFRVLAAPLIPGGSRGLVFFLAHVSLLFAFVSVVSWSLGLMGTQVILYAAGVWCYLVIYIGFGAAFGRAARAVSGDFRPAHTRVLTVLFLALASILPLTLYAFDSVRLSAQPNPLLFVTDPFSTLYRLAEGNLWSNEILLAIGAAAFVSILFNLRAMLAGVSDVARTYIPPAPAAPGEIAPQAVGR